MLNVSRMVKSMYHAEKEYFNLEVIATHKLTMFKM